VDKAVNALVRERTALGRERFAPQKGQALDRHWLDVQLPVPAQRSTLHLTLIQKQIQCSGHFLRALSQLFRQVMLADHDVSSWELLVDGLAVN
jgi:hypothetical protein